MVRVRLLLKCFVIFPFFSGVSWNQNVHIGRLNGGLVRPKGCGVTAVSSTEKKAILSERRNDVDSSEKSSSELCPGCYVALVTPFHEKGGGIDENALRKLLKWHLDSGMNGILALGTTGEANMLTYDEKVVHTTCYWMLLLLIMDGGGVVACW